MLWVYSKNFVTKKVKVSTKIRYVLSTYSWTNHRLISENKQGLDVAKGFDELDEQVCTSTDLWEYFAGYLIETYRIPRGKNKGKKLGMNNALNYLQTMIRLVKEKFVGSQRRETAVFLQCLDSKSMNAMAQWLRGLYVCVL